MVPLRATDLRQGFIPRARRATNQLEEHTTTNRMRIENVPSKSHMPGPSLMGARSDSGRRTSTQLQERERGEPRWVGGKLLQHIRAWKNIGKERLILEGLMPEWAGAPPPPNVHRARANLYGGAMHQRMAEQIEEELRVGAIEKVEKDQCLWISPTFLVPKKGGEWRKVMDCRGLNKYIIDTTFQMEDHRTLALLLERRQYAVSIDIEKAYYHVPVNEQMQPYLAFHYGEQFYRYLGMPFGVRSAPRVFTHIMRATMTEVRKRWHIASLHYLDDLLFLHSDRDCLQRSVGETIIFLTQLGWTIKRAKTQLTSLRTFVFLAIE
jgi:hypothetical protein